jgi:hypothetical protein
MARYQIRYVLHLIRYSETHLFCLPSSRRRVAFPACIFYNRFSIDRKS